MPRLTDRQPTPPPGSPFLPPAPGPQLPPAAREVQQRATAGLILVLLTLIAMLWGSDLQRTVYVVAVTLVISLVGLALVISAMRSAKRAGTRRPRGAMAGAVLGVLAALFSAFALIGFLVFWSQIMQYAHCMNGASTVATRNACQQQFDNSVSSQITLIGGGR